MKKILFLLLCSVVMYAQVPADATPLENIQITNNTTDNSATKVVVQSANNVLNTVSKTDLQDAFYFATASALPVTGITDKLYITRDDNKLYRFNGTIYVLLNSGENTEVASITELLTYQNKTDLVTVTDLVRGGDFYYVASGLTADNGVVFPALGGGFWVRKLEGFVYPEFWGTGATTSNQFIQSALNYAAGKNLTVKLKAKQYNINDVLIISSNTHLQLDDTTVIRLNDNSNTSMLRNSGAIYAGSTSIIDSNITVSGGTWEGNGANQSLFTSGANPSVNVGLEFHNASNIKIKNTKIVIARSYAFYFSSVENVYIDKVNIDNGNVMDLNRDGLHFNGPAKNIFINDCILRGTDDQIALNADDVPYAYKVNSGGTIENVFVNNILFNDCRKAIRILPASNNIKKVVMTNITGLVTGNLLECSNYGLGTGGKLEDLIFSNVSVDANQTVNDNRPFIIFESTNYGNINFDNIRIKGSHFTTARLGILEDAKFDYFKIKDFVTIGTDNGAYSDIEVSQLGTLKPTIGTFIIDGLNYSSVLKTSPVININNLTISNFQILNSNIGATAKVLNLENSTLGKVFFSNNSNDNSANGVTLVNTFIQSLELTGSYFKDIDGFALSQDTPSNIVEFKANAYIVNDNADVSTKSFVTYKNNGVSKSIAVNGISSTATDKFLPKISSNGNLENSSIQEESSFLKSSKSFLMNSGNYLVLGNENTGIFYSIGYEDGNAQLAFRNGRTGQVDLGINNLSRNIFINSADNGVDKLQVGGTISADPATLANQVVIKSQLDLKADLASPALTGTPTAPTATAGTNTTQIATTAFVLANAQSIPQLESNATDLTVWNNGKGNVVNNTSFGDGALKSNTTGQNNTAFGHLSLNNITTNSSNTAFGRQALQNSTVSNNTGIGNNSLGNITTGSDNTALGNTSGHLILSGAVNSTGSNSVFLGSNTRALNNGETNQIVIGEGAIGAGSNTATLGNASITKTVLRGTVEAPKLNLSTTSGSQSVGNANMVGGTVTVTTTAATPNSVIMLTRNSIGITGFISYTTTTGSFTINSNVIGDAGVISYVIFN